MQQHCKVKQVPAIKLNSDNSNAYYSVKKKISKKIMREKKTALKKKKKIKWEIFGKWIKKWERSQAFILKRFSKENKSFIINKLL